MQVHEIMTKNPKVLPASSTIREAASRMKELHIGAVPVSRDDKVVGLLTDRDIAIKAVAEGKGPEDSVDSLVDGKVLYCYEKDDVENVLRNMQSQNVQRLLVMDSDQNKDLTGIITLSDIADKCADSLPQDIARACKTYH
ncbi:CBS domain-containing protein [Allohahella marinimesophila]|uniref:CBS domain-containing protein n=1 Tax=Allohahella marinimesophila TaxID=1054972 RepID=A0ABP7PX19_9GAMM